MHLLFYSTAAGEAGKKLQGVIEELVPEEKIEVYRTEEGLSRRLREPTYDLSVAVLLAATNKDLLYLLANKELIWNLRVILILPDREEQTITKGHLLRPRFLTYADGNFLDVATVLGKMLQSRYPENRHSNHLESLLNSRRGIDVYCKSANACFKPRKQ